MKSWKKIRFLGAGSYGRVFLAVSNDDYSSSSSSCSVAAVKSADFHEADSLKVEGRFLAKFEGNPNIVRCFGEDISMENGRKIYNLLLEYAAGGTLQNLIETVHKHRNMPEIHAAGYARMLLNGLAEIHSKGIVHCDLKPGNILVFPVVGRTMMRMLKIADFGLARTVWEKEEPCDYGSNNFNRGTPLYASPESVACGVHNPCSDVWALGCIVVEMITGKSIWKYKDTKDLFRKIVHKHPKIPPNLSQDAKNFLEMCLEKDPTKRWSALKLLEHPFIVKNSETAGSIQHHQERFQKNPFGYSASTKWVTKQNLFSTLETQQKQLRQFHPYRKLVIHFNRDRHCGAAAAAAVHC